MFFINHNEPYIPKTSRTNGILNEVDVNGTPVDDNDNGGTTEDFTGEPVSVTGNDNGRGNDPAPTNDTPPADDTGGDTPPTNDGGGDNTEDFTAGGEDTGGDDTGEGDTGVEGDDNTEDFTAGGDDLGGDDGGGEGGDTGADDAGGGDSGGGTPGDGTVKADDARGLENEIFGDLTPTQIDIKHKELKNNFVTMHTAVDELINRVNEIPNDDTYTATISFVSEQLSNLKEMITDYLNDVYSTKSYMENAMNYNRFLATLNGINEILKEINDDINKNNDNAQ